MYCVRLRWVFVGRHKNYRHSIFANGPTCWAYYAVHLTFYGNLYILEPRHCVHIDAYLAIHKVDIFPHDALEIFSHFAQLAIDTLESRSAYPIHD